MVSTKKKKLNVNKSYGKVAYIGATDTAVVWKILDVQPED